MRRAAAVLGCTLIAGTATPASAQWIYQGSESAFSEDALHMALTGVGAYGFGFRCRGENIEALYMTPDTSFTEETLQLANMTKPQLRVRVDDRAVVDIEATIIESDGNATAMGSADLALVSSVRDAKKRVAVVIQLLDDNYHEQSFNVRGSTSAVNKMIAACGLDE